MKLLLYNSLYQIVMSNLLHDWTISLWKYASDNKIAVTVLPQQSKPTIYGACFATGPLSNGQFTEFNDFKLALAT